MKRKLHPAGGLLAAATLLLAGLLIWQCASIYIAGTGPENLTAAGTHIHSIYSREIVAERLGRIWWAFALWIAALIAALMCRAGEPHAQLRDEECECPATPELRGARAWRVALCAAAAVLVAAGILNGGARDVLIKAANICTECIGLG